MTDSASDENPDNPAPTIQLRPVVSSNILAVGHCPETDTLAVQFKGGQTYHYPNCTAEEHDAFVSAESIGSHFHKTFKGREFKKL